MIVLGTVTPSQSRPGAGLGDSEWLSIKSPPPSPPSLMCRCSGCHNGTVSATAHQSASLYAGACMGAGSQRICTACHGSCRACLCLLSPSPSLSLPFSLSQVLRARSPARYSTLSLAGHPSSHPGRGRTRLSGVTSPHLNHHESEHAARCRPNAAHCLCISHISHLAQAYNSYANGM